MSARRPSVLGVNLAWLVPGVVGGSEEYTIRLLQAVGGYLSPGIRLRLFARADLLATYPDLGGQFETVEVPATTSKVARIAVENSWLAVRTRQSDAVHHAGGTVPFLRTAPAIVTIHDLQPLDLPENFHPAKRRWLQRAIPAAAKAARLVICPSHFTASRLHERLGVPGDKLRVVPHGHNPASGQTLDLRDVLDLSNPEARYGRYLLYPAIAYAHKRHIDLVRALDVLDGQFDDVAVVFTGRAGPEMPAVLAEAERLGVGERVHALGRVPAAELEALYRSAVAMVFPSGYEGFGNPALEAMNFGCPAIVSDGGALPEVVEDAGLTFPVGNVGAMAAAIGKVLADPLLADDLRRRGFDRAARFDVGIAAWRLAEVYREVFEVRRRAR
ncbi:MAG: glycosyltransferase family 1 protein [Actinomycetota bacterium]